MIQALADLQFLRPQWLWGLLLLPLLALWWQRRRRRDDGWRRRVDPHLLPHLLEAGAGRHGAGRALLGLAALALAILALAGPGWRHQAQPLWEDASPLVIAVDLSTATAAADLQPSRLLQARAAIAELLRARAGGQVALVAFAGDAYTVAPMTADAGNVRVFLDALAPDIMPVDGSRPERAIEWSVRLLQQAGSERGDILLLTHDAGVPARRAAAAAARAGHRVSVLGLGTAEGASHRDARGRIVRTRLDADALRALATAGGGRYADLATEDPGAVLAPASGARAVGETRTGGALARVDQGYWLLLPLMLLAALAFRRGGGLFAVALLACLPVLPAQAQEGGWWRRADQAQHARARAGVEAYRRGDHAAAERAWQGLPGAAAAYNRGNALARAGRFQEALDAYDDALALQPGMEDAVANRRAVEAAMQRQPPQGPGEDPAGEPREGGQGDQGDEGDASSGHGAGEEPPQDRDADEQGEEPAPEADAQAQEEADEAQRERMRRAMQGDATQEEAEQADAEAAETTDERERREANEAWLQRIPDDPGGLLRARFRLEHERRRRDGAD